MLFEGGAGETERRNLLFFDRKPGAEEPWTRTVWVYDLRTNKHFTLKTRRLARADLDGFVECYRPGDRHNRRPTWSEATPEGRWRPYRYEEIVSRAELALDPVAVGEGGGEAVED